MKKACLISCLSGFAVMVYEMLIIRVAVPWIGNSFSIWSGTISLILLGLFVGNIVGGKIADHNKSARQLASILLGSAGLLLVVRLSFHWLLQQGSLPLLALASTQGGAESSSFNILFLLIFYLLSLGPAVLLGMICPYLLTLYADPERMGYASGQIFGYSSVGGILGTLGGGAFLIPYAGVHLSFVILFLCLIGLSLWLYFGWARLAVGAVILLLSLSPLSAKDPSIIHEEESVYGHLQVREDSDGRKLIMGSAYSLQSIDAKFARRMPRQIWNLAPTLSQLKPWSPPPRKALILGLGAGSMVAPLQKAHPGIEVQGVEIDPKIIAIAYEYFDLDLPREQVFVMDARQFIRATPDRFDLVILDAYRPPSIPYHLTTSEFFAELKEKMTDDSLLLVNYSGVHYEQKVLGGLLATIGTAFGEVQSYKLRRSVNSIIWACTGGCEQVKNALSHRWRISTPEHHEAQQVYTDDRNPVELQQELQMVQYALSKITGQPD